MLTVHQLLLQSPCKWQLLRSQYPYHFLFWLCEWCAAKLEMTILNQKHNGLPHNKTCNSVTVHSPYCFQSKAQLETICKTVHSMLFVLIFPYQNSVFQHWNKSCPEIKQVFSGQFFFSHIWMYMHMPLPQKNWDSPGAQEFLLQMLMVSELQQPPCHWSVLHSQHPHQFLLWLYHCSAVKL